MYELPRLKRLRKSKDWLYAMCVALFQERGVALSLDVSFQVRAFDATLVKAPRKTGVFLAYSLQCATAFTEL